MEAQESSIVESSIAESAVAHQKKAMRKLDKQKRSSARQEYDELRESEEEQLLANLKSKGQHQFD